MKRNDLALLFLLGLVWGGAFVFTAIAVVDLPPLTLATIRYGLAAIVLCAWMWTRGIGFILTPSLCLGFLAMGLLNNLLPFTLIAIGQLHVSAGLAAILNSTAPLFGAVLTPLLTRNEERFSVLRFVGVFLGIGGVATLSLPALTGQTSFASWALLPGLGAALSYAVAAILGLRFRSLPVMVIAAGQLVAAAVLGLPLVVLIDGPWLLRPSLEAWAAVLALALFCTAGGYLIYFRLLVNAGATNALLVTFLIPPAAILIDLVAFGRGLPDMAFPAALLILAGIACVDGRAPTLLLGRLRAAFR